MAGDATSVPSHFQDWNASNHSVAKMEKKQLSAARAKSFFKRPLGLALLALIILIILIAIIVPLAIVLPKRGHKLTATILFPLYIYPANSSSWSPLYDVITAHPDLKITVIVNPSSGPGEKDFPNDQYASEVQKLNSFPNVKTIGYVRTGYASRNLSDVTNEVSRYAGWSSKNSSYAMHGIFFDESPHQYSADAVDFMRKATQHVKNTKGLLGDKTIVRNPGIIPDARFNDTNTDISVVFEESYPVYQTKTSALAALTDSRSAHCYMVNSVPLMAKDKLRDYVKDLSQRAEYLFATSNDKDFYESFASDWPDFADVVPR